MFHPRIRSSHVLAVALAIAACQPPLQGSVDATGAVDPGGDDAASRRRAAAVHADARPTDAGPAGDARTSDAQVSDAQVSDAHVSDAQVSDAGGGGGGGGGIVSCYTEGAPNATCTLPTHCCFTNYSSQHDGFCMNTACSWGTIDCDGPEDCPSGQRCCAHVLVDPNDGITGYRLACQASACGAAPANEELCHPTSAAAGTCTTGSRCVSALGNDSDLPPTLHICQ
jgi:hypothetical protein